MDKLEPHRVALFVHLEEDAGATAGDAVLA